MAGGSGMGPSPTGQTAGGTPDQSGLRNMLQALQQRMQGGQGPLQNMNYPQMPVPQAEQQMQPGGLAQMMAQMGQRQQAMPQAVPMPNMTPPPVGNFNPM